MTTARASALPRRQRGVILIVVLLVLIALSLTAVSLTRTVDTSLLIAGNIAFKQNATAATDEGVEEARCWLLEAKAKAATPPSAGEDCREKKGRLKAGTDTPFVWNDATEDGYFPYWEEHDFTGNSAAPFPWTGKKENGSNNAKSFAAPDGSTVRYVIHRLCRDPGGPTDCLRPAPNSSQGGPTWPKPQPLAANQVYYQVTVRVEGPRSTVSHVQAIILN